MIKVLILDDCNVFLKILELSLDDKEFIVKTVSQKRELFLSIKSFKPDIIVLDIFLDKVDGRLIAKEISESSRMKHIPVILMSSNPYALQDYRVFGAQDFIQKSFVVPALVGKIKKLVHKDAEIEPVFSLMDNYVFQ